MLWQGFLKGDYRPDHDPIRVWQRTDGTLAVISGRHRLAHTKAAGASRIISYLYEESPQYNQTWALRFDVESNILDNQATALECALYVRGEYTEGIALTDEQITRAGLSREGTEGAKGYRIGRNAGESIMTALRNNIIEVSDALALADFIPCNDTIQQKGLSLILDGGSKHQAIERMAAEAALKHMQEQLGLESGTDLFGNALENEDFMRFVANYVTNKKNELRKDASYLRATVGRKTSPLMATRYGIDIKDPNALKLARTEVATQIDQWRSPYTNSELMNEIRDAWAKENPSQPMADFSASSRKRTQIFNASNNIELIINSGQQLSKHTIILNSKSEEAWAYLKANKGLLDRDFYDGDINMRIGDRGEGAVHVAGNHAHDSIYRIDSLEKMEQLVNLIVDSSPELWATSKDAKRKDKGVALKGGEVETRSGKNKAFLVLRPRNNKSYDIVSVYVAGKNHKVHDLYDKMEVSEKDIIVHSQLDDKAASLLTSPSRQVIQKGASDTASRSPKSNVSEKFPTVKLQDIEIRANRAPSSNFSLGGMRARTASNALSKGETFIDPSDGKEKFFIDSSTAQLKDNFRIGELTGISKGSHRDTTLKSLLDFPALYEAYPFLSDMRVRVYKPTRQEPQLGCMVPATDGQAGYIAVNMSRFSAQNTPRLLNTLVHEAQHAIQFYEGHSLGATIYTPSEAKEYVQRAITQRESLPLDDWGKDNLAFLHETLEKLKSDNLQEACKAADSVYIYSRGEQEAREAPQAIPTQTPQAQNTPASTPDINASIINPIDNTLNIPYNELQEKQSNDWKEDQAKRRAYEDTHGTTYNGLFATSSTPPNNGTTLPDAQGQTRETGDSDSGTNRRAQDRARDRRDGSRDVGRAQRLQGTKSLGRDVNSLALNPALASLGCRIFTFSDKHQKQAEKKKLYTGELLELPQTPEGAKAFTDAIRAGAAANEYGELNPADFADYDIYQQGIYECFLNIREDIHNIDVQGSNWSNFQDTLSAEYYNEETGQ